MYNAVRSASIITKEDSSFWALDRVTFKKILQDLVSEEFEINRKFIEKVSFFSNYCKQDIPLFFLHLINFNKEKERERKKKNFYKNQKLLQSHRSQYQIKKKITNHLFNFPHIPDNLTPLQIDGVAGLLIEQKFKQDQWIVNVNDQAESFYVIKKGQVGVYNQQGEQVTTLGDGKSFGENALMSSKAIRSMTIKALEETVCLALARDTLHNLLGNQVESIINR